MKVKINDINQTTGFAIKIGIYTLILGTSILTLYYFTEYMFLPFIGLLFLFVAILINTGIVFNLLIILFENKRYWKKILITISVLLINVPVAIMCVKYGLLVFYRSID